MTSTASKVDLSVYCQTLAHQAKAASQQLLTVPTTLKDSWLRMSADRLQESFESIMEANQQDLAQAEAEGLTGAMVDRLRLDQSRIDAIARGLREVASLPDPVGEVIEGSRRPNGLEVLRVRVPLGVVLFIYESRPNVTVDAAALCVKSGNAVILRGGREAAHSSRCLWEILKRSALATGLPANAVQMVGESDRAAVGHLLQLSNEIDVVIPRGGESLIRRVVSEAKMPVIKHFDGNCHVYVDASADGDLAESIVVNAKCQRMGVCNAAESLLIHQSVAARLLPRIGAALIDQGIELRGCPLTRKLVPQALAADEQDYRQEYLGPKISVRVVDSLSEAIDHINEYGSHHTDAIVTSDLAAARQFTQRVDSAAVIVNASTRFNDGHELGLGSEIGISTDKLHARGPCGLRELTSYKYVIYGDGQVRH
jgi:glutamate-5-semialdehyde dehydrogenase